MTNATHQMTKEEKDKELRDHSIELAAGLQAGTKKHARANLSDSEERPNIPAIHIDLMPSSPAEKLIESNDMMRELPNWFFNADGSMNIPTKTSVDGVITDSKPSEGGELNQWYIGENGHVSDIMETILNNFQDGKGQFIYLPHVAIELVTVLRTGAALYTKANFDGPLHAQIKLTNIGGQNIVSSNSIVGDRAAVAVLEVYTVVGETKPDAILDLKSQTAVAMQIMPKLYRHFGLILPDLDRIIQEYFRMRNLS